MDVLVSSGFPMDSLWISCRFVAVSLWNFVDSLWSFCGFIFCGVLIHLLQMSCRFLAVSLFFVEFCMISSVFLWVSCGLFVSFLWISCGVFMCFLWISSGYGVITIVIREMIIRAYYYYISFSLWRPAPRRRINIGHGMNSWLW